MIFEFSLENFLSFKDRSTFSMIANGTKGLDQNYVVINDKRILKTSAIYGANASGKSNILKVLRSITRMLKESSYTGLDEELPITPFKLDKNSTKKDSFFEIIFFTDNTKYKYGFCGNKKEIKEEYLYYYPNGRESKIFHRTKSNIYSFPQKEDGKLSDIVLKTPHNKFFIATATNWNYEKTRIPYDFLCNKIRIFKDIQELDFMSRFKYKDFDNKSKSMVLDILKKADLNIEDYEVIETPFPDDFFKQYGSSLKPSEREKFTVINILIKHRGSIERLSLQEESLGTQILFSLLPFMIDAFRGNEVLFIDELEKSLHPFLVELIVNMFNDIGINTKGAQLIFTTHNTNLLNLNILRKDQIWFAEKDSVSGISTLFSLSDFSIRRGEDIEKNYLLGRYGATPNIKNELNLWDK